MVKNIYIAQFGTGSNINLLPLAAGQLVARLKQEKELLKEYNLGEIIFRREDPEKMVSKLKDVFIAGFSCFLWNMNHSLEVAKRIKSKFPDSLIVLGGPSIPKDPGISDEFLKQYPFVDVICIGEGEEVFAELCKHYSKKESFSDIPGIIYYDRKNNTICRTGPEKILSLEKLPSPYLDGTFDDLYRKYSSEFSGIILETNRGCPYRCSYCTWGSQPSQIREKSMDTVKKEIKWIGKNKIRYIAMSDANFGFREKDLEFSRLISECNKNYGFPNFISVSWAKNSSDRILEISKILKERDIGFRITLSLQSLNNAVLKAIRRQNMKKEDFDKIKIEYIKDKSYSYTELIFGLPLETYSSYISGIENLISESIFEQLYVYPLFLFPNTEIASTESRKKYGIESRKVRCAYTKSKDSNKIKELVEIVIGNYAMPKEKWVNAFVIGYYTLALHNDRLAFFILNYLKKKFGIKITDLITFARDASSKHDIPIIKNSFLILENCALGVQNKGEDHLIRPISYGGIPFDPPEGIFLELLLDREKFYSEFLLVVESYLKSKNISFDKLELEDLFKFQEAVIAHPNGPIEEELKLKYNWVDYFAFTFQLDEKKLMPMPANFRVVDPNPCYGDPTKFLKNHFDIRGVPALNLFYNEKGNLVFPPLKL